MSQIDGTPTIEERDAADRALIAEVEDAVVEVVKAQAPSSLAELSRRLVEAGHEGIAASVIRAAVVRLLNAGRLKVDNGHGITAA